MLHTLPSSPLSSLLPPPYLTIPEKEHFFHKMSSEHIKRIRQLEDEILMLRDCLERGVTIANQDHAQNVVEMRMLKREQDTLREQLQHTTTELSGDVYIAFSEVKRLSAVNVDLLRSLELKCEEVSDLKHKLSCINEIYLTTSQKLEEAEARCNTVRQKYVDQQVLVCSLRRVIANHHESTWAVDETEWCSIAAKQEDEENAQIDIESSLRTANFEQHSQSGTLVPSAKEGRGGKQPVPLPSLLSQSKGSLGEAGGASIELGPSRTDIDPVSKHRIFKDAEKKDPLPFSKTTSMRSKGAGKRKLPI